VVAGVEVVEVVAGAVCFGTLPTTVRGVGETIFALPQPARTSAGRRARAAFGRIGRRVYSCAPVKSATVGGAAKLHWETTLSRRRSR
jgi:hypothetical protein